MAISLVVILGILGFSVITLALVLALVRANTI